VPALDRGADLRAAAGEAGVHLLDSASARFGEFDEVQLAGLVEGEWPDLARRSIFYSPSVLRELGWPSDTLRLDGVRAEFADLLRLPRRRLTVSTFALESDALVSASSLLDELARAGARRRGGGAAAGACSSTRRSAWSRWTPARSMPRRAPGRAAAAPRPGASRASAARPTGTRRASTR
jgi:inactivated superfamily I helicase